MNKDEYRDTRDRTDTYAEGVGAAEPAAGARTGKKYLLIGRAGGFARFFAAKLNKLNHTVYHLTDTRDMSKKAPGVFERYRFDLTSDSIREVADSVRPDTVIYLGSCDTMYDLKKNSGASQYISALMNVLISCSACGIGDFIYLSSSEVFGSDYPGCVGEDEQTSPRGTRSLILAQAEDICLRHGAVSDMRVTVVRFDNLFGIPHGREDATDFCSAACLDALLESRIEYNGKRVFSGVYFSDAAEGLYLIASSHDRQRSIYHISSGAEIDEVQLAYIISALHSDGELRVSDRTEGERHRLTLGFGAAADEFGYYPRRGYEESVGAVYAYMKKHLSRYLTDGERKKRSFPGRFGKKAQSTLRTLGGILENLIVFVLVFLADRAAANVDFFNNVDFYLLYTLAFAVIYGRQMAVLSAFLSVIGFGIIQAGVRGGFTVLVDFNTYIWMAQLFIVAMTVGRLRDRIAFIEDEKDEEIQYLSKQLSEVEEINDANKRIKHIMEYRLVNYTESLGMLHEMISQIDSLQPGQVLFRTASTVRDVLPAEHVAVYRVYSEYARLHASTSHEAGRLGKSIRVGDFGAMSQAFSQGRVFINNALDPMLPSMATGVGSPASGEGGERELEIIIMVWHLSLEQMTLRQANMLTVIGQIVSGSVYRAGLYRKALEERSYTDGVRVLKQEAFSEILGVYEEAAQQGTAEYTLLYPHPGDYTRDAAELIIDNIRSSDYVGILDGRICLLLTCTNAEEAEIVRQRLADAGVTATFAPDDKEDTDAPTDDGELKGEQSADPAETIDDYMHRLFGGDGEDE